MAPYLIIGLIFGGVLHVYFPSLPSRFMKEKGLLGSIKAAIFGVPMPLCSCGVLPTAVSLKKNGASKSAVLSFLISTPQTGFDSIFATYSVMGLPMALARPIIAFLSGVFGGTLHSLIEKEAVKTFPLEEIDKKGSGLLEVLHYAVFVLLADIKKYLIIGILLAAFVDVYLPADVINQMSFGDWDLILALLISVPLYVCATGSIPVAAVLVAKGLSPGAAIVFLMAGPATNIASIILLKSVIGLRSVCIYLFSIAFFSIISGFIINQLGIEISVLNSPSPHHSGSNWLGYISAVLLILALIMTWNIFKKSKKETAKIFVRVEGMSCSHCVSTVKNAIIKVEGVTDIEIDLPSGKVYIQGDYDKNLIENAVMEVGFKFKGWS